MKSTPSPAAGQVPILLVTFNRLDPVKRVFETVREAAPARLYLASDGAREQKAGEAEKVDEVRRYLQDNITWPCEIQTLYQPHNLGCKYAVSAAISWFFEHEEMGIILEDDCLPSKSFYAFCNELLEKYKDDTRVWQISGYNLLNTGGSTQGSYLFSNIGFCWGWASWRRAWKHFDVDMKLWPEAKKQKLTEAYPFIPSRNSAWEETYRKKIDTWDYQWNFTVASNSGLSVVPTHNLVRNIGFGADATHTFDDPHGRGRVKSHEIPFPLTHPHFVFYDQVYEQRLFEKVARESSLPTRVKRAIKKIGKKITK